MDQERPKQIHKVQTECAYRHLVFTINPPQKTKSIVGYLFPLLFWLGSAPHTPHFQSAASYGVCSTGPQERD